MQWAERCSLEALVSVSQSSSTRRIAEDGHCTIVEMLQLQVYGKGRKPSDEDKTRQRTRHVRQLSQRTGQSIRGRPWTRRAGMVLGRFLTRSSSATAHDDLGKWPGQTLPGLGE